MLRALCYPGGTRLPQLVTKHLEETELMAVFVPSVTNNYQRGGYTPATPVVMAPLRNTVTEVADFPRAKGNMGNEAYRWFCGSMDSTSSAYQCRGCLTAETDLARRVPHVRECRLLMQAIAELVQRDRVCVVCNLSTGQRCWTIPLCSDMCRSKWRFQIPNSWLVARRLAISQNPRLDHKPK